MMRIQYKICFLAALIVFILSSCNQAPEYKTLIITGQSNHDPQMSSIALKQILDVTGLFRSEILPLTEGESGRPLTTSFSGYDLIVLDAEGDELPQGTGLSLMDYVYNGGGLIMYNSTSDPASEASDSLTVSERHDFDIRTMVTDHPVTKGLPLRWFHPEDVIVQGLNPSDSSIVLAAAWSDTAFAGTGRREPVLIAREYGGGRIFATMIGSPGTAENKALNSTGFIVTFQRGAEWAATGTVTQEVPFDFPTAAGYVLRSDFKAVTEDDIFDNIGTYGIAKSTKYYTGLQDLLRKAAGSDEKLLSLEKRMVAVLKSDNTSEDAKKLILKELSWMGSDYCIPAIKELVSVSGLEDEAGFALSRLQK